MPSDPDPHKNAPAVPLPNLPAEPQRFFATAADNDAQALEPPAPAESPSALERLGPSPFPRNKFPFLGFLASVYDHVAQTAQKEESPSRKE